MRKKLLLFRAFFLNLLLLLITSSMFAQPIKISGTVTDSKTNTSMPGVNVIVKGSTTGVVADVNGNYTITVDNSNAILVFSFVGYKTTEIPVNNQSIINVSLEEELTQMEEVVVVGYGTQKKSDLTGAVTVVKVEDINRVVSNDISKLLQGQASGVQIHNSGEPGSVPIINIRGIGSFTDASPLYVIDGIPIGGQTNIAPTGDHDAAKTGGIADFSPSDIESVQILKDASACAIYGARGANGVVIITTKKGKKGEIRITYEGSYGWQNIAKERYQKVTNREQFQKMNNIARDNDGMFEAPANDPTNPYYITNINTDWQKESFKTGIINNHSITASGGSDVNLYNINMNYFDQTGTLQGPGPRYTHYTFKLNTEQKSGKLKLGQSIFYSYSHQIRLENSQWGNPILNVIFCIPTVPVYDKNNPSGFGVPSDTLQDMISPNEIAYNSIKKYYSNRNRFLGIVYGEYELIKGLSYKINLSYDRADWFDHEFIPVYDLGRDINKIAKLSETRTENPYMLMENTLTFIKEIGKHNLTVLAGYTAQYDYLQYVTGTAQGYSKPYFEEISSGTSVHSSLGQKFEHTMYSYLGRINYSYADKYLLTTNFRLDASSRFGVGHKTGTFPSLALGWKINNEEFLKDISVISLLKLRASYGKIGNDKIGDYMYNALLNNNVSAVFGGQLAPGTTVINLSDASIKWEGKVTKNIGVDLALFKNKFEFSAEYYHDDCSDLLLQFPIPWSTGSLTNPTVNAATMTNQGLEFIITFRKQEGNFHYSISANLSTLKNTVTGLGTNNEPVTNNISQTVVGRSMGELYGYVTEGIFQNTKEIADHAFQSFSTVPGDIKFKDLNGDSIIDKKDQTYLGKVFPSLTGGMNISMDYNGFDLSVFVQGVYGNKAWNGEYDLLNGYKEGNYSLESYNNYWRGENSTNAYPRLTATDPNTNDRMSNRWVQDASYLRIQSVQLGYTFTKNVLKISAVKDLRIYVSAQNLYTFTKYTGFDPDFVNDGYFYRGMDNGSYPSPRTYMIGIKATF